MSAALTFPQELINGIIDLFPRDFATLRTFSLVSRSFRDSAQKVMFREANLLVPSSPAAHGLDEVSKQSLYETLASSPRLSSYVSSFILRIAHPSRSETYLSVLRNLSCVRTLKIFEAPSMLQLHWETLQDDLKSDILRLLGSPTLVRLELDQIKGFPLNSLRHCPHLVHIRMIPNDKRAVDFDIATDPLRPPDLDTKRGFLKRLTVDSPVTSQQLQIALRHPSSRLSLTDLLRYETVVESEEGFVECDTLLQLSASTLEEFIVAVRPPIPFARPLDLRNLHSLSRVRFRSTTYESLSYIYDALETVSEVNMLNTVELVLYLEPFTLEDQDVDAWRQIDILLTKERHAARLQAVVVNIRDVDDDYSDADVVDFFNKEMPKLHAAGYLRIEVGCRFRA